MVTPNPPVVAVPVEPPTKSPAVQSSQPRQPEPQVLGMPVPVQSAGVMKADVLLRYADAIRSASNSEQLIAIEYDIKSFKRNIVEAMNGAVMQGQRSFDVGFLRRLDYLITACNAKRGWGARIYMARPLSERAQSAETFIQQALATPPDPEQQRRAERERTRGANEEAWTNRESRNREQEEAFVKAKNQGYVSSTEGR